MRIVLIFLLSCIAFSGYSQVQFIFQPDSASADQRIYTEKEVDTKPAIPGGDDGIMKLIGQHIKYPVDARRNRISGTVLISFVVEKDGSMSKFAVHQKVWPSLDQESLRVSQLLPNTWSPAILNGSPVRCRYQLPIRFVLQ